MNDDQFRLRGGIGLDGEPMFELTLPANPVALTLGDALQLVARLQAAMERAIVVWERDGPHPDPLQ